MDNENQAQRPIHSIWSWWSVVLPNAFAAIGLLGLYVAYTNDALGGVAGEMLARYNAVKDTLFSFLETLGMQRLSEIDQNILVIGLFGLGATYRSQSLLRDWNVQHDFPQTVEDPLDPASTGIVLLSPFLFLGGYCWLMWRVVPDLVSLPVAIGATAFTTFGFVICFVWFRLFRTAVYAFALNVLFSSAITIGLIAIGS